MTDDPLLLDVRERIATITLNRPRSRNALSIALLQRLPRLVVELDDRSDVDVVILTGADPSFCAGLDMKGGGASENNGERLTPQGSSQTPDFAMVIKAAASANYRGALPSIDKPLIGAINGAAITGGLELALACDFLVASEHACFADTHARVGVQPGWGMTVLLPQAVGLRRAREMSATSKIIDAQTALAWGLVNHVVPHNDLLPFTRKLAAEIVSGQPSHIERIYRTYDQGALVAASEAWDIERGVFLQGPAGS